PGGVSLFLQADVRHRLSHGAKPGTLFFPRSLPCPRVVPPTGSAHPSGRVLHFDGSRLRGRDPPSGRLPGSSGLCGVSVRSRSDRRLRRLEPFSPPHHAFRNRARLPGNSRHPGIPLRPSGSCHSGDVLCVERDSPEPLSAGCLRKNSGVSAADPVSRCSGRLVEVAMDAAKAGGEVALRSWRNLAAGEVSEKKKNDFVTNADRESEERIVARIRESFPADNFLGEEGGSRGTDAEARTWIIDPIDGTSNFIAGFPFWCVSVAAREGTEMVAGVVWDPLRQELYTAERGSGAFRNGARIRVTGRPGLDGAFLATGFPFRSRDK